METVTKPGYKHTELGWIPEDWEIKQFGEICTPSKSKYNPLYSENKKCIELEDLAQETGRLLSVSNSSEKASLKTVFTKRDVLLGKLRPYLRKYLFAEFDGVCSTEIWVLKAKERVASEFVFYHAQSDKIIEAANLSTGTKMPRAEWKTVSETIITIPQNIKEQTAIATALSDMDSYISSLEALIAKKRKIKQGAMQELLTPKEDWEMRKLGEVGDFKNGINKGEEDFGFGFPFVNLMDVFGKTVVESSGFGLINSSSIDRKIYNLQEGDVLFIRSSVKPEGVGLTAVINSEIRDTVFSGFLIRFRDNGFLDKEFKKHCFSVESFRKKVMGSATVSANTNINQNSLSQLEISFPSKVEQRRIGSILNDIDFDINSIDNKLSKALLLKQGMMQELLTGRTRLV